jgi:RHS repeat-associated protein
VSSTNGYDPVGNRLSLTTKVGVVNYQYDAANRLTSVNGQAYTWDDNGNLLNDGLRSYSYDHANRLTQVVSGTLTTEFVYNGAGDRVARTVDGVTTGYVLDPAAGLPQVLQESTDGQTASYLYGHDLLAQYDSGTWAYHLNDGLGSVRQLTDPAGQVVQSYSFSPFGVPLGESGGEPYGFTGEQWDASAGLVYLRARYMQPSTGRFISRDPFPGYAYSPQSLNRWVYVQNNPVGLVDPSGLQEPVPVPTPGPPVAPEGTPASPAPRESQPTPTLPPGPAVPVPPGTPTPKLTGRFYPLSYCKECESFGLVEVTRLPEDVREMLVATAVSADLLAAQLSAGEAIVVDLATAGGAILGPGAFIVKGEAESVVKMCPVGRMEDLLGIIGFVATAGAETKVEGQELVIGQDTMVTAVNATLGLIPESNIDFLISAEQYKYDIGRTQKEWETYIEIRIGQHGVYVELCYVKGNTVVRHWGYYR